MSLAPAVEPPVSSNWMMGLLVSRLLAPLAWRAIRGGEGFVALDGHALGVVFGAANLGEVVLLPELAVLVIAQDGVQDLGLGVLGAAQGGLVGGVGEGEQGLECGHGGFVEFGGELVVWGQPENQLQELGALRHFGAA